MSAILWNKGEESIVKTWLQGSSSTTFAPTAGTGNWGVGLGAQTGGVGTSNNTNKAKTNANNTSSIGEIDQTGNGASGYGRRPIQRSSTGWPATDPAGNGSWSCTPSAAASFSFTSAPNLNGATLWFVAASQTTIGTNDCLFGADLAATRTYQAGDTENVTPTYKQT